MTDYQRLCNELTALYQQDFEKNLTDEEFLSSPQYVAYCQNRISVLVTSVEEYLRSEFHYTISDRVLQRLKNPKIHFSDQSKTDGEDIYLGITNPRIQIFTARSDKHGAAQGSLRHEEGHLLFTDFYLYHQWIHFLMNGNSFYLTPEQYSSPAWKQWVALRKKNPALENVFHSFVAYLFNALEDKYVNTELFVIFNWKGETTRSLACDLLGETLVCSNATWQKDIPVSNALLDFIFIEHTLGSKLKGIPFNMIPVTDRLLQLSKKTLYRNPMERYRRFVDVLLFIFPYFLKDITGYDKDFNNPPMPAFDAGNEDGNASDAGGSSGCSEAVSGGGSDDAKGSDTGDGSDSSEAVSGAENDDAKGSDTGDSSDGSEAVSGAENDDAKGSDTGDSSDSSEAVSGAVSGDGSDANASTVSSSADGSSLISDPGDNEAKSAIGQGSFTAFLDLNLENRATQQKSVYMFLDEDQDLGSADLQGKLSLDQFSDQIPAQAGVDSFNDDLKELLKEMAEEKASKQVELQRLSDLSDTAAQVSQKFCDKTIEVNRIISVSPNAKNAYKFVEKAVQRLSKKMQKEVIDAVKRKRTGYKLSGLPFGRRFESNALYRQDGKVFSKRKAPNDTPELLVGILIDQSSSTVDIINKELFAALVIEDMCRNLDIPLIINGYCTSKKDTVSINSYAEPDSADHKEHLRLMSIRSKGNTPTCQALAYMLARMKEYSRKVSKILFVITDGQSTSGKESLPDLISQAHSDKILLIAAGVGSDRKQVQEEFPDNFLEIDDLNKLAQTLGTIIRTQLIK